MHEARIKHRFVSLLHQGRRIRKALSPLHIRGLIMLDTSRGDFATVAPNTSLDPGKLDAVLPAKQPKKGSMNRIAGWLVQVISSPAGDQGGWEGGARGL
jgi:hypothetical protein